MNHKKILKLFVISMMFLGVFGFLFIEKTNAQVGGNFWKLVSSLLQPNVSTWSIYAPSNLRFDGEIQPDGSTCANGEILKKTATNDWDCASDTGGTFPFTADTYGGQVVNATSTGLFLKGTPLGLVASTTFATRATTTSATTTNFAVASLTSALLLTDANGSLDEYAGTTCTNQFVRVLSVLGVATCATVGTADVAGLDVSDDTNLAVTSPITLTGDTVGFDFSTSNTWTGANIFNNITRSTTTSATSTNFFSTTASTTNLAIGGGTLRIFGTVGTALSDFCTAITGGAGLCVGSDDGGAGTSPFASATTTEFAVPNLAYFTQTSGRTTLGSVATGTVSASGGVTVTAGRSAIGGSLAITCSTADTNTQGCLSDTDWDTFNSKQATISATWPITLTGAAVGFNGISTSTAAVIGNIPYFSWVNTFANVATSSLVQSTGINIANGTSAYVLGAQPTFTVDQSFTPTWTGAHIFNNITRSTTTQATTTTAFFTTASTTNFFGAGLQTCQSNNVLTYDGAGKFGCEADYSGTGGSDPFTHPSVGIFATTTNFIIGSSATASSTLIGNFNITGNSTTSQATTTNFFSTVLTATTGFFTNVFIGADTLAEYISDTAGAFFTGNTETGIKVTYQDADNTVDVVCNTADTSTFGCLTDTDWDTFNGKQSALTFTYPLINTAGTVSSAISTSSIPHTMVAQYA